MHLSVLVSPHAHARVLVTHTSSARIMSHISNETHTTTPAATATDTSTANLHTDTAAQTAPTAQLDATERVTHAWTTHESLLLQQLSNTLPSHMHQVLSLITSYVRPSPLTYWRPDVADAPRMIHPASSRVDGVPYVGWDVTTGAVAPIPSRPYCLDPIPYVLVCQVNFAELPPVVTHVLGGATRMLQVFTCAKHLKMDVRIVAWTQQSE